MGLDDAQRHAQPQAGPLTCSLGGEERIKDLAEVLHGDARAIIIHLHAYLGPLSQGTHRQRAMLLDRFDRLRGVDEEVEEDLLELVRVGPDVWERWLQFFYHADVIEV